MFLWSVPVLLNWREALQWTLPPILSVLCHREWFVQLISCSQMISTIRLLMGDEQIVKEFDLNKPENILNETVSSVSTSIKHKLDETRGR